MDTPNQPPPEQFEGKVSLTPRWIIVTKEEGSLEARMVEVRDAMECIKEPGDRGWVVAVADGENFQCVARFEQLHPSREHAIAAWKAELQKEIDAREAELSRWTATVPPDWSRHLAPEHLRNLKSPGVSVITRDSSEEKPQLVGFKASDFAATAERMAKMTPEERAAFENEHDVYILFPGVVAPKFIPLYSTRDFDKDFSREETVREEADVFKHLHR